MTGKTMGAIGKKQDRVRTVWSTPCCPAARDMPRSLPPLSTTETPFPCHSSIRVKETFALPADITARYGTKGPRACKAGTAPMIFFAPKAIEHEAPTASPYD